MRLRTQKTYGSLIPPTDLMSVSVLSWRLVRSARAHPQETECDLAGPPDACRLRPARQMKGCGPKRPSSGRCTKPPRTHEPAGSCLCLPDAPAAARGNVEHGTYTPSAGRP